MSATYDPPARAASACAPRPLRKDKSRGLVGLGAFCGRGQGTGTGAWTHLPRRVGDNNGLHATGFTPLEEGVEALHA
eukprot:CAMPEP_0118886452 /NCGR_PEP_ID=MMETSP1163-20130328/24533_1 /TAXON_ID=124430 /ORGANISM="Phaeomonas parva, Strain CCMP2877" /LENGTH=76 /DNA_ID=CAMNT_0006824667 /DNA_START=28 /DNA_END=256 /DNA_ORIENTATION=-